MSVKKFSFILKTAKIFRQNLPTHVKEHDVSLFWLPLGDMPSTSRLALCIWHIQKARVKYRVRRISCFYSAPGLAWQACLKKTGINLELLTDPDMLLMFERGIRGEITQAVHRHTSANNKYMGDKFNPKEESSYLQHLDANNLYGWVMSQPPPTGGFEWVDPSEFTPDKTDSYTNEGYLLEVDVRCPKELHDLHNDLPFM